MKVLITWVVLCACMLACASSWPNEHDWSTLDHLVQAEDNSKLAEMWAIIVRTAVKIMHLLGCLSTKWTDNCSDQIVQCLGYFNVSQCTSLSTCGVKSSLGCVSSLMNPFG